MINEDELHTLITTNYEIKLNKKKEEEEEEENSP